MSKQNEPISFEQAKSVLDIYGGLPDAWPANMREKVLACIAASADLQQEQQAAVALDKMLTENINYTQTDQHGIQSLSERIIAALPEQNAARKIPDGRKLIDWLPNWLIQPIPVTVMAIAVLSISIINIQNNDPLTTPSTNETIIFEDWAWLDITGQALSSQNNQIDYGLMDFLELEANDV